MAKFNLKGKGKRGKRPLEGTKVYRAIQGKPKFHVDQSINNNFGQNISFPSDFKKKKSQLSILIDRLFMHKRCYSIKKETKAKLKVKDGK